LIAYKTLLGLAKWLRQGRGSGVEEQRLPAGGARRPVTGKRHRVLIADDHEALRRGVRLTLEAAGFRVVAECADAAASAAAALRLRPELCLLDVNMPGGGIEAATEIHRALPGTKIVMLTASAEIDDFLAALRAGASGYLLKSIDLDRLPLALLGVLRGEAVLPGPLVPHLIEAFREQAGGGREASPPPRLNGLTRRESEVLELLAFGYSTTRIASRLAVADVTVRSHIATTVRKLQVSDRDEAVRKLRGDEHLSEPVEDLNGVPH
jgi:two-component system, NarL family, nitrate/nitrite response regulator NarL